MNSEQKTRLNEQLTLYWPRGWGMCGGRFSFCSSQFFFWAQKCMQQCGNNKTLLNDYMDREKHKTNWYWRYTSNPLCTIASILSHNTLTWVRYYRKPYLAVMSMLVIEIASRWHNTLLVLSPGFTYDQAVKGGYWEDSSWKTTERQNQNDCNIWWTLWLEVEMWTEQSSFINSKRTSFRVTAGVIPGKLYSRY